MIRPKVGDVLRGKKGESTDMNNGEGVVIGIRNSIEVQLRVTVGSTGYRKDSHTSYANWYKYMDVVRDKEDIKKTGYKI
jgi:hypothetical protein